MLRCNMINVQDIYSLTDFQRNAKIHLSRLKESGKPEVLTVNGQAEVIVQDAAAYQQMFDLIDSLKHIKKAAEAFDNGEGRPIEEFFAEFEKKHGIE